MNPQIVATTPFADQRPGTSGLRKKTRVFMQPGYLENFIQSVFNALREGGVSDFGDKTLVVGGDGRFYNRTAIQTILRMAAGNGFGQVLVGRGGILSTPAMSAVIRARAAMGGLILSASHNPGGINEDFGVKYNIQNGGPAPEGVTERIYQQACVIRHYLICQDTDVDLDREGSFRASATNVEIIDPLADYTALMQRLFDFEVLRALFRGGFRMIFDAMHGVTGPYAQHILEELLEASPGSVLHGTPLEDFGGHHPDPNLVHAAELVARLSAADAPDFGAACDGDGDRNLILGRNFFVTPGDSLAVIAEHARESIPGYRGGLAGVARSMPTSTASDRVARCLGIPYFETPTGWKYFGNLMDAGLCTVCGEESFGTGSNHVREKDGLWAVLAWLSIVAATRKSVADVVRAHWQRFGRSYFQRHDYEGLDSGKANRMLEEAGTKLAGMKNAPLAGTRVTHTDEFRYVDPVDGSVTENQGTRLFLEDGSRVVWRLSGTGTSGATLRVYLERYRTEGLEEDLQAVLAPLAQAAREILDLRRHIGTDEPSVIT